jgi:glycosyltransferase involved in cell wall biosynthesis
LKLKNVEFRGLLPKREIPTVIGEADACLAVLKKMDVLKYGINPNKLFDYLASGRPILFGIESRNNPVAEAGAGLSVPAEDPGALSDAIIKLITMERQKRKEMGDNGLRYVSKHFDINILADRLESMFLGK